MRITAAAKDSTRKRILKVAQKHFAKQGFEATTTRDIAREAKIAAGTLFNYFSTKEAIVDCLVSEACCRAAESFASRLNGPLPSDVRPADPAPHTVQPSSLEEDLFAHIAAILRELKPYRKYLPVVLESSLSPLAAKQIDSEPSLREAHLQTVGQLLSQHERYEAASAIAFQLYWTLYTGALAFWAKDASPHQEDTLALLDQSLNMFVGWLTDANPSDQSKTHSRTKDTIR
jgi:AcrR family transcriptional regulator